MTQPINSKRLGIVDMTTGELYEAVITPIKRRSNGGPWMRLYQNEVARLVLNHPEIHGQSWRILWYLATVSRWDNEVTTTAETSKALGLPQSNVSRAYGELIRSKVLIKHETRYYLSPLIAWKGTDKAFEKACYELIDAPREAALLLSAGR